MKFFVILEIILVLFRVSLPFLAQYSQLFEEWQTAMTWICVVVGAIAAAFVVLKLFKGLLERKNNE